MKRNILEKALILALVGAMAISSVVPFGSTANTVINHSTTNTTPAAKNSAPKYIFLFIGDG